MFKAIVLAALFFITLLSYSQKYGHQWHFGNQAGIDFKGCEATAITTSAINGFEGCAAISDSAGDLLFYTNSDQVWNKQNIAMANGNLISSNGTISQVLIIPKPSSTTIYYIITSKIQACSSLTMQYHVVDMQLNSGLGEVVSKNNVITTWNITEQLAATWNSNGTDIWLMTHEYGTNNFLAFAVTSAGISTTPVISSVGPAHLGCTSNINSRGEIKFSPDGSKIAFNGNGVGTNNLSNILSLFDFDNVSGIVSNEIALPYSNGEFGLSFSPDNSKLYGSTWKAFAFGIGVYNYLYQFDLSSGNPATIINSKTIIDSISSNSIYGSLKIGPDGRIYVARANSTYLGVIYSPNLAGVGCGYVSNGFYLGGKTSTYGLNNYIEYQSYCSTTTGVSGLYNNDEIKFYPNPFSEQLIIYSENKFEGASLIVFDEIGKEVVKVDDLSSNEIVIKRGELSSGIYFVKIVENDRILMKRKIVIAD
ncbi:MAG: T9SS type A sorting domain-containing protein [Bacteroidetes bacterium]|nr:T9SS type A sorting domain-containing protein [Bacteroidota bacterium]